jgi:hypothetical protein
MPTFQVGDRVRCINAEDTNLKLGAVYRVTRMETEADLIALGLRPETPKLLHVRRRGVDEGYFLHHFELVEKVKPPFQVGDFVEVVRDGAGLREGGIYVIARVLANGLVTLEWRPGKVFAPSRFRFLKRAAKQADLVFDEPATKCVARQVEADKPVPPKRRQFQVGDRVRCLKPQGYQQFGIYVGIELTVIGRDKSDPAVLHFQNPQKPQQMLHMHASRFELVERPPPVDRPARLSAAKPYVGSLDEYGAARVVPVKPNPMWDAINRRFPTHRSDIVRALDELRRE